MDMVCENVDEEVEANSSYSSNREAGGLRIEAGCAAVMGEIESETTSPSACESAMVPVDDVDKGADE